MNAEIELLTAEYAEEILAAGAAKLMSANDLAQFLSELVLGNFGPEVRLKFGEFARETAHLCLLPEECRKRGIEVDAETAMKLKEALSG